MIPSSQLSENYNVQFSTQVWYPMIFNEIQSENWDGFHLILDKHPTMLQTCKTHNTKWSHWPKITNDTCYTMSREICQKVTKEDQIKIIKKETMCKNKWNAFNSNYKRLANYHKTPKNNTFGSCLMKKSMISLTLTIQLRMLWFHWSISRWKGCECLFAHEGCECWRKWSLRPTYKKDSRWEWWLVIIKQCPKISNFGCKHWWCKNY